MAYIGRQLARGENKLFDDISSSFNGSTTAFNLTVSSVATATATPYQLFVSLGGVMQKPNTDFTTAGNQITFTTAPAAGLSCWIMMQGDTIDQAAIPDASVTPSKISGSNFAFSGDLRLKDADGSHYVGFASPTTVTTNKVWTLPAADGGASTFLQTNGSGVLSWAAVTIGGGSGIDFNDNVKARWGTGNDLEIFHNASNSVINDAGTGDLLLQVGGSTKATVSSTGLGVTGALTVSTNATISGNLTVSGTTTTVDSVTLSVKDKNIEMGVVSSPSDTTADGGGITLKGASDKSFNWVNATDAWTSSEHIHLLDNKKLLVGGASGTADGLEVVHDGSNSILNDTGTGTLKLQLGGSTKLEITSGGIDVTGAITVDGAALSTAPTVTGTASGAITANKAVMVKSDGNFEQVTGVNEGAGSLSSSFDTWATGDRPRIVYNATNSRFLAVYSDSGNNDYPTSIVGTVSGTSISWGTPTVITSTGGDTCTITWNPTDQKAFAIWKNGTSSTKFWIGTMAGGNTSITWGSELSDTGLDNCKHLEQVWNPDANRHAMVYRDGNDGNNFKIKEYTITSGSVVQHNGFEIKNQNHTDVNICYDTTRDRYLCVGGNIGAGTAAGTLYTVRSGSGYSPDTPANTGAGASGNVYHSTSSYDNQIVYDANANRSVVFWKAGNNSDVLMARVIELDGSDNVTFGTTQTLLSSNVSNQAWSVAYEPNSKKIIFNYASSNEGTAWKMSDITINTSDNSMTVGTPLTIQSTFSGSESHAAAGGDKVVAISNKTSDGTGNAYGVVLTPSSTNLESNRYIGFSAATYSNGNTATVNIASNTSTQSSMTPAAIQYVQADGAVGATAIVPSVKAGIALTATKLLIEK